jgi:hypothetical protein
METQTIIIETTFCFEKYDPKKNILDGKYDFEFPPDLKNIGNKELSITIRRITCIPCLHILSIYILVLQKYNNDIGAINPSLDVGFALSSILLSCSSNC